MSNTTMVSLHIDDTPECLQLEESRHICLKLSPFSRIYVKRDKLPALIELLKSMVEAPAEERIDVIRGAA